jgi:hypothetical protein
MKKIVLFLLMSWSFSCFAQYDIYCLKDFAGWYRLSTINPSTGIITEIAPIPVVDFYVLGNKQCISTHDSTYIFVGHDVSDARLYTVTMDSANILHNPIFNGKIVGLEYNCNDSTIYAIEEVSGGYDFVSIDKTTGATTQIGFVSGVTAYVGDAFVLDENRGVYHFFGLFGGFIKLYSIDITTGLVTSSPFFPDNVTGLTYNCQDSTIYGLWEDGTDYKLESIDPITAMHTTVGVLSGVDPGFVAESAAINYNGECTYRGFVNTNFELITIDVQNANILHSVSFSDNVSGIDYYACCKEPILPTSVYTETEKKVAIFPNPFIDYVNVEWSKNVSSGTLYLFDINGKRVFEKNKIYGTSYRLNRENLSPGIYFLRLYADGEEVISNKIIAQ